jgi:phosphonopyruvate decarboxylase
MISGAAFADLLEGHGFDFIAGVPCSLVEDLITVLESHPRLPYVAAVREDVAVGLTVGAWFGGKRPAVLMQNSGLGTSLNALASLALMYGIPSLLMVTWRGYGGQDAPEHLLMGAISPSLLELLHVPYRVVSAASLEGDLTWAASEMDARMQPVALLIPPGVVEVGHPHQPSPDVSPAGRSALDIKALTTASSEGESGRPLGPARISRLAALAGTVKELGGEALIHANGYVCRESFSLGDRPQNFYMIGSMGLAPAIGLGLALARPHVTVVIADGDGNLLMNLGVLAQVGALRPANFVHVVFDNEVYGSTGNQRSPSRQVRLDRLASAAGYATATAVTRADEVGASVRFALGRSGPHFVLVKVTLEEAAVPRIPYTPAAIRDRFRASVGTD